MLAPQGCAVTPRQFHPLPSDFPLVDAELRVLAKAGWSFVTRDTNRLILRQRCRPALRSRNVVSGSILPSGPTELSSIAAT